MALDPATQAILKDLSADIAALKTTVATLEVRLANLKSQFEVVAAPDPSIHSNGLGQTYVDMGSGPGQPGVASTYTLAMAVAARAAWPFPGMDTQSEMQLPPPVGNVKLVIRKTATSAAVWAYTSTLAGRVKLNTTPNTVLGPSASDPVWT